MIDFISYAHYLTIAFTVIFTSLGNSIGGGRISIAAIRAINTAPGTQNEINKAAIVGLALIETGAILGVVMAIILLGQAQNSNASYTALAELGIGCALCITGFLVGLKSALPAQEAVTAIARQPFFSSKIINLMLLTQSIIQTPVVFAFLIALLIKVQLASVADLNNSIRLLMGGICLGIGSIGPLLGLAHFAKTAVKGLGFNRNAYSSLLTFTFISQAIIETPVVFALLISILLVTAITIQPTEGPAATIALISAGLCMGFGTFGAGISSGKTAEAACKNIAVNPDSYSLLLKTSMLGQSLIDASAGYALLISLLILFLR